MIQGLNRIKLNDECKKDKAFISNWKEFENKFNPKSDEITGNNAVICGQCDEQHQFLLVVDFDDTPDLEKCKQFICNNTDADGYYIVKTGSGGYHFYFVVEDVWQLREKITNTVNVDLHIDTRAQGGLVFGEGTKFTDKDNAYTHIEGSFIPFISFEECKQIYSALGHPIDYNVIQTNQTKIQKTNIYKRQGRTYPDFQFNDSYLMTEDEIRELDIVDGNKLILMGKIILDHGVQNASKVQEFRYWAVLWEELFTLPNWELLFPRYCNTLLKVQPEFDIEETMKQLDYRPSKKPTNWEIKTNFFVYKQLIIETFGDKVDLENLGLDKKDSKWQRKFADAYIANGTPIFFIEDVNSWCYWNGISYVIDNSEVNNILSGLLLSNDMSYNKKTVDEIKFLISMTNTRHMIDFDINTNIIVMLNGFFDVEKGMLLPSDKNYLCLKVTPYTYTPTYELTKINEEFFTRFDKEERERLLYICKATLDGTLYKNKMFAVLHGVTGSGKTSLVTKLGNCIGSMEQLKMNLLDQKFTTEKLMNTKFAVIEEAPANRLNSIQFSFLKEITGGGKFSLEGKNKTPITKKVDFSLWITCNQLFDLPEGEDNKSFFSRSVLFDFKVPYPAIHYKEFSEHQYHNENFVNYLLTMPNKPLSELQRCETGDIKEKWESISIPIANLVKKLFVYKEGSVIFRDQLYKILSKYGNGLTIDPEGTNCKREVKKGVESIGAMFDRRNTKSGTKIPVVENIDYTDLIDKSDKSYYGKQTYYDELTPKEQEHLVNGSVLDTVVEEMKQESLLSFGK